MSDVPPWTVCIIIVTGEEKKSFARWGQVNFNGGKQICIQMMHISNGSSEALSAAFLLWDQPGALDADICIDNKWNSSYSNFVNFYPSNSTQYFTVTFSRCFSPGLINWICLDPALFCIQARDLIEGEWNFLTNFTQSCVQKNVFSSYLLQWHVKWYGMVFFLTWGNWDLASMSERSNYLPKSFARPRNQHWLETYFDSLGHLVNLKEKK